MFVNHFNSHLDGGAATAARRLHAELLKSGTDSRFYYSASEARRPELDETYIPTRWASEGWMNQLASAIRYRVERQAFKKVTRDRPQGLEVFTSPKGAPHTPWPPQGHPSTRATGTPQKEIVHLHWIAKFLDYQSFFGSIDPDQPVVWTLHDMNAMTGGCHFSDGCTRFQSGCGNCPQLTRLSDNDFSRQIFEEKQAALAEINLHIVAPSHWLLDSARSSELLSGASSFSHIPYGISTEDYYPMDRAEARARLGIDPESTVFCFGAMDVKSRRKGAQQMLRALSHVADMPGVEGLVFGSGVLPESQHSLPKIHQVGPVRGTLAQRTVYSAADAFVLPSLEDNLPLTGIEAMACGTPVLGFDAGGIPDYVRPGQTGWLARTGDAEDLGRKLRMVLSDPAAAAVMGQRARRRIEAEFTSSRESAAYQALYAALQGNGAAERSASADRRAA